MQTPFWPWSLLSSSIDLALVTALGFVIAVCQLSSSKVKAACTVDPAGFAHAGSADRHCGVHTEASLLLHVVDVSHPNAAAQTQAVMQVVWMSQTCSSA